MIIQTGGSFSPSVTDAGSKALELTSDFPVPVFIILLLGAEQSEV